MPKLNNTVNLTAEEVSALRSLAHKGAGVSARKIMHANILLFTNDGLGDKKKGVRETAELFGISPNTVNLAVWPLAKLALWATSRSEAQGSQALCGGWT